MQTSRFWLFLASIIGSVMLGGVVIISIAQMVRFGGVSIAIALPRLLLAIAIIVFLALVMVRIKKSHLAKGFALTIVILSSVLIALSFFEFSMQVGGWFPRVTIVLGLSIFDFNAGLLGLFVGCALLAERMQFVVSPTELTEKPKNVYSAYPPHGYAHPPHGYAHPAPAPASAPAQPTGPSNEELRKELEALKSLLDDGLISQEEYDKRKAPLLQKLS